MRKFTNNYDQTQNAIEKWLNDMLTRIQLTNQTVKWAFESKTLLLLLLRKKKTRVNETTIVFVFLIGFYGLFLYENLEMLQNSNNKIEQTQSNANQRTSLIFHSVCLWFANEFQRCLAIVFSLLIMLIDVPATNSNSWRKPKPIW